MTTTTERIANAIKHIIEEDRRADRERIAELERDLNAASATIDDLNRQLDEAHKENARLVMERDFYKGAAPSAMRAAAPGQTSTATGGVVDCNFPACGPRCKKDCPPLPVVEEQGPWVVYDADELNDEHRVAGLRVVVDEEDWDWSSVASARGFQSRSTAEAVLREMGGHWPNRRVITLAEARAIEAKRNG